MPYWVPGPALLLLDISDPTNPTLIANVTTPGTVRGITVAGGLALVADGEAGLRIIDIDDPSSPMELGFYDTPDFALDVVTMGDIALVADGRAGLRVIDIGNPTAAGGVGVPTTHRTSPSVWRLQRTWLWWPTT